QRRGTLHNACGGGGLDSHTGVEFPDHQVTDQPLWLADMIKLDQVSCSLGDHLVLKDISFDVQEGEILVILGDSGSGKTTILRLILGLIRPDSGKIFVDGEEIIQMSERKLMGVRHKIGMVFQEGALFDSLTVG